MEPILNSPAREIIRQKNTAMAEEQARQVTSEAGKVFGWVGALAGMISIPAGVVVMFVSLLSIAWGDPLTALLGGAAIGFITFVLCGAVGIWLIRIKENKERDDREQQIHRIHREADKKIQQEIKAYEDEVEQSCQKVLQNADNVTSMTNHVTDMLQRRISHADASSNRKFLEAALFFTVNWDGIVFSYESNYTNPMSDYNFDRERFRNLNSPAECEGLARALVKLTIQKIKEIYSPDSITEIKVEQIDAAVTIHFKAANKNFQTSKDIL